MSLINCGGLRLEDECRVYVSFSSFRGDFHEEMLNLGVCLPVVDSRCVLFRKVMDDTGAGSEADAVLYKYISDSRYHLC